MRHPVLGTTLTELGPDQLRHLHLHQLPAHRLDRFADHVSVLIKQHLPDDLLGRHAVGTGHAALLSSSREKPDDSQRRVGRNRVPSDAVLRMKVKLPGAVELLVEGCGVGAGDRRGEVQASGACGLPRGLAL